MDPLRGSLKFTERQFRFKYFLVCSKGIAKNNDLQYPEGQGGMGEVDGVQ